MNQIAVQTGTFSISGSFQGPLSERIHPPCSAQVQVPPRKSGNSLVQKQQRRMMEKKCYLKGEKKKGPRTSGHYTLSILSKLT